MEKFKFSRKLKVRQACPGDASRIVSLIARSFSPAIKDATIYGCSGISKYVQANMAGAKQSSDSKYFVAELDGEMAGCAEFRVLPRTIFLNYICVLRKLRGGGIGEEMLRQSVPLVKGPETEDFKLDVFFDNAPALSWYHKLGFESAATTDWWSIPLPKKKQFRPNAVISGLPQAQVCHRQFGFSHFTMDTPAGSYRVGKLGEKWFRISQPQFINDHNAMQYLCHQKSGQKLLCLFSPDSGVKLPKGTVHIARSIRMEVSSKNIIKRLFSY